MRRKFDLPEADADHLRARGLTWETVVQARVRWLIIHDWPVPPGYNHTAVQLALRIEPSYPTTQIDMAYFYPALARADGKAIRALANQTIDRQQYQRWSRHRTAANPWRPGEDDLSTHLLQVEEWLRRELTTKGLA
ncbi:MAG TPA: E2/UBC family protein [Gemmataceae bacterium]|nr:E2/UBC family protein [Gemmataceae bacterium]